MLAAIVVQIAWGLNYSASKLAMVDFPPLLAIAVRFVLLTIILLPLMPRYGIPTRRVMRDMVMICLTTIVFHFALLLLAINHGLNVTSCILAVQLGVPFSCIFASVLFKDFLGPWRSLGLLTAFIGVLIVAGTPNAAEHWDALLIAVAAALGWSAGNLYLKIMKPSPVIPLLFWPGLMAIPIMAMLSLIFESHQWQHVTQAHWHAWVALLYSAGVSSLVGYGLWNWLLTRYPVNHVVPFTLLLPIFGISGGVLFFHDPLSWRILLGALFTLSGVGIIALRRPKLAVGEEM